MNVLSVSKNNNNIPTFTGTAGLGKFSRTIKSSVYDSFLKPVIIEPVSNGITNIMPTITIKDSTADKINNIAEYTNRPHVNRGLMGFFALISQPLYDWYNKKVDEDTAHVSAIRTGCKVIAGTAAGIFVRGECYKLTDILLEEGRFLHRIFPFSKGHGQYQNLVSTAAGLAAMCVTNFIIDAPLTNLFVKWGLNLFNKITKRDGKPSGNTLPNQTSGTVNQPTYQSPTEHGITQSRKEAEQMIRETLLGTSETPNTERRA